MIASFFYSLLAILYLNMNAAQIVTAKEALQVRQLETPKPKGSQVLVKVKSSGFCHSDIRLWEGGYQGPEANSRRPRGRQTSLLLN